MKARAGSDNKIRISGERVKLADGRDLSINSMEMLRWDSAGLGLVDEGQLQAIKKLWERRNGRSWNPSDT